MLKLQEYLITNDTKLKNWELNLKFCFVQNIEYVFLTSRLCSLYSRGVKRLIQEIYLNIYDNLHT